MTLVNCTPGYLARQPKGMKNFWSPFYDEFFRLPDSFKTRPAVNIRETPEGFELQLAAPGLNKEDFKIRLEDGLLSLSAAIEKTEEQKDEKWSRREFSYSAFERSFRLPDNIDAERINARYVNGVLHVSLPKVAEVQAPKGREIQIG